MTLVDSKVAASNLRVAERPFASWASVLRIRRAMSPSRAALRRGCTRLHLFPRVHHHPQNLTATASQLPKTPTYSLPLLSLLRSTLLA